MPAVEVTGVGDVEVTHEFAEVAERSFRQKMEVVVHEDISMQFDAIDVQGLKEDAKEGPAVVVILKNVSPFVSAAGNVVYRSRILYSQRSGHGFFYGKKRYLSTIKI